MNNVSHLRLVKPDHELQHRYKLKFEPVRNPLRIWTDPGPQTFFLKAPNWEDAVEHGCRMAGEGYRLVSARRSK